MVVVGTGTLGARLRVHAATRRMSSAVEIALWRRTIRVLILILSDRYEVENKNDLR